MKTSTAPLEVGETISKLKGLIALKAIQSWKKLPHKTRCYIDVEDMIEDGVVFVARYLQKGSYNPKKAKLSSVLFITLENHYRRGAELLNAQKRFDGLDASLDELKDAGFDPSNKVEMNEIALHVRRTFLYVYNNASEQLRESIRRWFFSIDETKIHIHSSRFLKDKKEFRQLADRYGLDANDCRMIMNVTQVRNEVVSRLPEYNFVEVN